MKGIKFITERSEKGYINPMTGRGISKRVYVVNSLGQVGCLPNETKKYSPIGGKKALLEVIDILVWI
jgi:hypothetical protein